MYIVSTGICVQVHVLIRLACVYQPLYDFWLNFQQNAILAVWPYLLRYLEFLDRTRDTYGEYIKVHVGSLIRMNFGQIIDKMQFYLFGNISQDI